MVNRLFNHKSKKTFNVNGSSCSDPTAPSSGNTNKHHHVVNDGSCVARWLLVSQNYTLKCLLVRCTVQISHSHNKRVSVYVGFFAGFIYVK